jgi:hypothetical protein
MEFLRKSAKKKALTKKQHQLNTKKFNELIERFNKEESKKTLRLSKLI